MECLGRHGPVSLGHKDGSSPGASTRCPQTPACKRGEKPRRRASSRLTCRPPPSPTIPHFQLVHSHPTYADSGAQVFRPARATVPPWLPAKSARVSNLPACCALGPLASAAQYSCRCEPCTGRSAWLLLGRACLSAWIEHRSGEQRSP